MATEPEAAPTEEKRGGGEQKKMHPWARAEQKMEISTTSNAHK